MKITLAQINPIVGDIDGNKEKIIAAAQQSKGSSLVVFPELSLCGFPPYNLLGYSDFIERCERAIDEIAERCDTFPCFFIFSCLLNDSVGFVFLSFLFVGKFFYKLPIKAVCHKPP